MPNNSLVIFKEVMQYIFWPFAFLMGVYVDDCQEVSKLIGYKVFVNEFFGGSFFTSNQFLLIFLSV